MSTGRRRRLDGLLRVAFLLVGLGFMTATFSTTWDRAAGLPLPSGGAATLAAAALALGLVAALRGWATLLDVPRDADLAAGFYTAQLGKYVPGAVWQAVGQVGHATLHGVGRGRASTAFVVSALGQAVAGLALAGPLALLAVGVPSPLRWGLAAGPLTLVLLHRGWMTALLDRLPARRGADPSLLPTQRAVVVSSCWAGVTLLTNGTAFALLLDAGPTAGPAVLAFGVAWSIGFLALPFPAGLGVREGALLVLLPAVPPAEIIAASVLLRLAVIGTEALLLVTSRLLAVHRRTPTEPGGQGAGAPPPEGS